MWACVQAANTESRVAERLFRRDPAQFSKLGFNGDPQHSQRAVAVGQEPRQILQYCDMGGGPDKSGLSLPATYLLSAASACTAETVTFPSDIVKTRLQVQSKHGGGPVRGIFGTAAGIVREEGLLALYKGLGPACVRHLVYSGTRVVVYEAMRETILGRDEDGKFPLWKGIMAAMTAGFTGQFIASPTDLVKVQMQTDGKRVAAGKPARYAGTADAFRKLYTQKGFRGMWQGWVPNCQRAALVQLGDLAAYDFFKHLFLDNGLVQDGPLCHGLSAFSAGLVAVTMSSPADVVKSRVMNQPFDANGRGTLYKGTLDCLRQTVRDEGFAALYKGAIPSWVRIAPWSLTFFLTFEQLRRIAGLSSF